MEKTQSKFVRLIDILLVLSLAVFLVAVPYNKHIVKAMGICLFVFWAARRFAFPLGTKEVSPYPHAIVCLLFTAFLGSAWLSTVFSVNYWHSVGIFAQRYLPFFLFFMVSYGVLKANPRALPRLSLIFLLSGVALGIGTLCDILVLSPQRLFSSFGWFVFLTPLLSIYFPFALAIVLHEKDRGMRLAGLACFVMLLPALVWHGSRLVWITFVLSLLFVCLFEKKTFRVVLVFVLLCLLGFMVMPPYFKGRAMTYKGAAMTMMNPLSREALGDRVDLAESSVSMFKAHPLVGNGPGSFSFLYKPPAGHETDASFIHAHAHNQYLEIAAETGLLGLLFYLSLYLYFFVRFFRRLRSLRDKPLAYGYAGSLLAILIVSCGFSFPLVGMQESLLTWFFLAAGIYLVEQNNARPAAST